MEFVSFKKDIWKTRCVVDMPNTLEDIDRVNQYLRDIGIDCHITHSRRVMRGDWCIVEPRSVVFVCDDFERIRIDSGSAKRRGLT